MGLDDWTSPNDIPEALFDYHFSGESGQRPSAGLGLSRTRLAAAEGAMRTIILQEFVSPDGVTSGRHDSVDFVPACGCDDGRKRQSTACPLRRAGVPFAS
jgi:hypothetical protein